MSLNIIHIHYGELDFDYISNLSSLDPNDPDAKPKPPPSYKSLEVLLVQTLEKAIESIRSSTQYSPLEKSSMIDNIQSATNSTNYGVSKSMGNSFIEFVNSYASEISLVSSRCKKELKPNGYSAIHFTYIDHAFGIPGEVQFITEENDTIAKFGNAAHQLRYGKQRPLKRIPISSTSSKRQAQELVEFLTPEQIQEIINFLPGYSIYEKGGNIHTCSGWENFEKFYEDQLDKMPSLQKEMYRVGLQRSKYFRDFSRRSSVFSNRFPYNALPTIDKLYNQDMLDKSTGRTPGE